MKSIKRIYFKNREEWRAWLEKNHQTESKISLIKYKKHTGKPSMSHKESMEEAICFGWIDTTLKSLDENKYIRNFSRRSKNSRWSSNTLSYAQDMIKKGKMSPEGLRFYKEGLKKPTIDHGLGKNPDIPEELKKVFAKDKIAEQNFNSLAPSYRRTYIYWLHRAKRPETKQKRIDAILKWTSEKKKPGTLKLD